jgi:hypothetical protein
MPAHNSHPLDGVAVETDIGPGCRNLIDAVGHIGSSKDTTLAAQLNQMEDRYLSQMHRIA